MPEPRTPDYKIELVIALGSPNKARGDALERLLSKFLQQQSYSVTENIRYTGTEIDLLAKHELSGRTILVECKSQKGNVQSAAIDGLFTDSILRKVDESWLVTLSPLGSDAKGKFEEIKAYSKKPFVHVLPQQIVEHAIKSGFLNDPNSIMRSDSSFGKSISLVITETDFYYCFERINVSDGAISGFSLCDAQSLKPISLDATRSVELCVDKYSEGRWLPLKPDNSTQPIHAMVQPVVDLVPGTDWRDYRPSRPEDFIGREDAIDELVGFLESVRKSETKTRIFGIKAASGWGKSSLVLKAGERIAAQSHKVHFLAVDCRAAVSSEYPLLVIEKAFMEARSKSLEFCGLPSDISGLENPFEDPEVSSGLQSLRSFGGLVVIVFDQFEEIIHSSNKALFSRLENLCYQIDGLQIPVVFGFSWRTDAMVSADNPGYNLWHKLADRRHDIQLRAFTHADAIKYIDKIEKSSGAKFASKDVRFLLTTYVGLPWLLKKLAVYMVSNQAVGADEGESDDPIKLLFDRDLEGLSKDDHACIRAVASLAPVPIHSLSLNFPESVIAGLIERRLIITSGGQLSVYSDIFRDYILYARLPNIPNTYCPYIAINKLISALKLLQASGRVTYSMLADELGIASSSADNVARDLRQMGLVSLDRAAGLISARFETTEVATQKVVEFFRKHIILQAIDLDGSQERNITFDEIVKEAIKSYRFSVMSKKTIEQYCAQVLRLAGSVGLIERKNGGFDWSRPIRDITVERSRPVRVMSRTDGFMGQAPPHRVAKLMDHLRAGICDRMELKKLGLRNAIFAANSLGLVRVRGREVVVEIDVVDVAEITLLAQKQEFVAFVREILVENPTLSGSEIGQRLADANEFELHPSSLDRYGNALRRWVLF